MPAEFSRPEVLAVLREYYAGLDASEKVEVKLVRALGAMSGFYRFCW